MTTRANLYVDKGIDFVIDLELFSNDNLDYPAENKTFSCEIKKLYSSVSSANAEVTHISSSDINILELYIPGENTENLDPGKYQYDIIMALPSGQTSKILEGLITIMPTITGA